jgi:hypothetical protein
MVRLLGEEMVCLCMLRRKEEEQLDEKERAYGFLGEEMMVCVGRGTSWTSGNCMYVEGRGRSYGTFAGR